MGKQRNGNIAAIIYFICVMWWILLLLILVPMIQISDIGVIRESGFSTVGLGVDAMGVFGLLIGLSLVVPGFRRMYHKLPWMFPLVKIVYIDVVIMSIATSILNYGYEVQSPVRHNIFFVLMICQIIICRALMCIYFKRKKVQHIGGYGIEQ